MGVGLGAQETQLSHPVTVGVLVRRVCGISLKTSSRKYGCQAVRKQGALWAGSADDPFAVSPVMDWKLDWHGDSYNDIREFAAIVKTRSNLQDL